jgi:hypothetical protein
MAASDMTAGLLTMACRRYELSLAKWRMVVDVYEEIECLQKAA